QTRVTLSPLHCFCCNFTFSVSHPPVMCTLSLHDALPIFGEAEGDQGQRHGAEHHHGAHRRGVAELGVEGERGAVEVGRHDVGPRDRKSTRLNSSHVKISYAVFCLKKKKIELM